MKGLYKGKYLIAVYSKNGFLVDVACSPSELTCFGDKQAACNYISKIANGYAKSSRVFLIDVTEKYDDVFAEEDRIFLEFIESTREKSMKEKTLELGVNLRTYYRKQDLLLEKEG